MNWSNLPRPDLGEKMAIVQHEISINRTPDEVWAVLGEFGGLDTWMDGVESCVVTGKTREIEIAGGMKVSEDEVARDDANRSYSYTVNGHGLPVEKWLSTVAVEAQGDGARATWTLEMEPDDFVEGIAGIYKGALDTLKAHLEG